MMSTKGILICTGWCGWDNKSGVSFLCHFDRPKSANSTPKILSELAELAGADNEFETYFVGGKRWCWSNYTRDLVKHHVQQQKTIKMTLVDVPIDRSIFGREDLICDGHGYFVGDHHLEGPTNLPGVGWFCEPMQRVYPAKDPEQ